jgi:hypothetical protein
VSGSRGAFGASAKERALLERHALIRCDWFSTGRLRYCEAIIELDEAITVVGSGTREPDPDAASIPRRASLPASSPDVGPGSALRWVDLGAVDLHRRGELRLGASATHRSCVPTSALRDSAMTSSTSRPSARES